MLDLWGYSILKCLLFYLFKVDSLNRYALTQLLSIISASSAFLLWWFFPGLDIYADDVVPAMLAILQAVIIPNAFFGLLTAILLLSRSQLTKMLGCFLKSVMILWGVVTGTLLIIWLLLTKGEPQALLLPTFSSHSMGVTIIIPLVMLTAIMLGYIISITPRLEFIKPYVNTVQKYVSMVFEYIFLLIPLLVFFVITKFLNVADFNTSSMAIDYFMLAILFVGVINFIVLPCLFHFVLGVAFSDYTKLVAPVFFMTFLAGDSIAAIPLIARAADSEGDSDYHLSRIITLVVICFPWLGELANLLFPIYSASIEGYSLTNILSILSVGPFFMFTDPYISIPTLMQVFGFPKVYQVTYLTLALLTDHMFEVCEALAVLFVVIRLKKVLTKSQIQAVSSSLDI